MQNKFTRKLKHVMKTGTLQIIMAWMLYGVCVAHANYGQVLDRQVSVSFAAVSFEHALKKIEAVANVKFVYSMGQLADEEPVSVHADKRSLGALLDEIFIPRHIRYKVHEKEGSITLRKEKAVTNKDQSRVKEGARMEQLLIPVSGTVRDAVTQLPMAGVNILVKGTAVGTTTDAEGRFIINAESRDVLVFSFIGFKTMEIAVEGQTVIEVALEEDVQKLGEVVVNAGYYTTTRKTQTGNIIRVESEDIEKQPVQNVLSALQGRVPGLEITQQTGVPGGNFTVRIRGTNSIANGNDPLYIIDGVPYISGTMAFNETSSEIFGNALAAGGTSPLNAINPADIESIEVLKDADATAIYGSRGANGVILITTKGGHVGKAKVDFKMYTGAGQVARRMNLLSTPEYLAMRKEARKNSGLWPVPETSYQFVPDMYIWDTTRYTDWQKELIGGTASISDAQLSVSGGEKLTQYSFGASYRKEGAVFPGVNADKRFSTHLSLNKLSQNEKMRVSMSLKYSINDTELIKRDLTRFALTLPPNAPPLYNASGGLNWGTNFGSDTWVYPQLTHPLSYLKTEYESTAKNLLGNAVISYKVFRNVEIKANLGYSDIVSTTTTTTPKSSLPPASIQPNESVFSRSNFNNWTIEPQVNWKPRLAGGRLDVLMGSTFLEQTQDGLAQRGYGYTNEALMKNLAAASTRTTATNYYSQYRYSAGFARINYMYKEKYIINLTGRRDGSSRFGAGRQFSNFGAIGAAWVISEEAFARNSMSFLSFAKLRASYGVTGNDQLASYQYLDSYTSSGPYLGIVGLRPTRLANPDFAWETNKKAEAALEISVIHNRISTSISYYDNRSSNQLVGFSLPPTTGFNAMQGNLPAVVQNRGVETILTTANINRGNFRWITTINLTMPRNKLLAFPGLEGSPAYANTLVVGEPTSIAKVYNYLGVDPETGLYQFEDYNEDGVIDYLDQQAIRFVGQDYYGGVHNVFEFKGFQVDVLFQFVKQTKANYLKAFGVPPGSGISNQPDWVMERWQKSGDITDIQIFNRSSATNSAYTNLTSSTQSITDGSFIRLKNVSLSWSIPDEMSEKMRIADARVFVQGQNLITITKFEGLDPEAVSATALPPLRILSAGLHLTF